MKLKTFNTTNTVARIAKTTYIGINVKVGLFYLNQATVEHLGLSDGDQIQFHQSEEDETEWYLEKVKENGFVVRQKENKSDAALFNNVELSRKIFDSMAYEKISGRVMIGEVVTHEKRKLYTLITSMLVN